jgi:hypothetical protein
MEANNNNIFLIQRLYSHNFYIITNTYLTGLVLELVNFKMNDTQNYPIKGIYEVNPDTKKFERVSKISLMEVCDRQASIFNDNERGRIRWLQAKKIIKERL